MTWAYGLIGLALGYFWPVFWTVRVRAGQGSGDLNVSVTAMLIRARLSAAAGGPGGPVLVVELRLLHVIPVRKNLSASLARALAGAGPPRGEALWGIITALGKGAQGGRQAWAVFRPARRFLLPRLRVDHLSLKSRLGLGDAAATALAYGWAWVALGPALGYAWHRLAFARPPEIRLEPVCNRRALELDFRLAVRHRQGDGWIAFILSGWEWARLRLTTWPRRRRSAGRGVASGG
ncbi:MAG: DUF2953 domain-containing protein [Firmicutes bacterium]|nr:DUF2953 domain-containing protein [Bacillota bacterium]